MYWKSSWLHQVVAAIPGGAAGVPPGGSPPHISGHLSPYRQACTERCLENTDGDSAVFISTISRGRAAKVTLLLASMIFRLSRSQVGFIR